jgi:catechol 2,3-dioxygenase-like lactoylglutathione lyase family enzyme
MAGPFDQQVTFLYTTDLEATADFYESALGLPLVLDQGACRIYRVAADAFVGLCTRTDALTQEDAGPSGVILTLVTNEVDAWYERLCAKGVTFEKPPSLNPKFNIYHCFLRDPNGHLVEIQRFHDPAWPHSRTVGHNPECRKATEAQGDE